MNYSSLGKSDLNISEIGLGAMSLPENKDDSGYIIDYAIDNGINFIDTADLYEKGQNEHRLGMALKNKRQEVCLATKVGNQWNNDGSGWTWNPGKSYILKAVEDSLNRLKTDYIDLYQLHGGTIEDPMDECVEAFEILVKQGKIRYYGISSIRPNVIKAYGNQSNIMSVMIQYSLLDRRPEEEILPFLVENQIGVLARGSVAKGLLIDKPARNYLHYSEASVSALQSELKAQQTGSEQKAALSFVLHNPAITSSVVGISNLQQLRQILTINNFHIDTNKWQKLRETFVPFHYTDHR